MNFHTVAQVIGVQPDNTSAVRGGAAAASSSSQAMGSRSVATSRAMKEVELRLSELMRNASLGRAAQTHTPLLTPPVELATLGAPTSASYRFALSGALGFSASVQDVPKPRRSSLKALARVTTASLETDDGWAAAVSAAAAVYKPDELHLATPVRRLARAHYRVAGGTRPYTVEQLAHAGLREVREPNTGGAAAKRMPKAAHIVD